MVMGSNIRMATAVLLGLTLAAGIDLAASAQGDAMGAAEPANREAMMRELVVRAVVSPAAAEDQREAHGLPQPAGDGKVLQELRLLVECGHRFDVTVTANGEVWRVSGSLALADATQGAGAMYRAVTKMSLRKTGGGVEEIDTNVLVRHGKDAVLSELAGAKQTVQWIVRVEDARPGADTK